MLTIRLQRVGRKNDPSFRVVVTDSKNAAKSGKFLEIVGAYDARQGKGKTMLNSDRIKHWMSVGARVSDTVHNLLVTKKVVDKAKIIPFIKKETPVVAEAPKVEEAAPVAPETPAEASVEETPAETPAEETPAETPAEEVKEEEAAA